MTEEANTIIKYPEKPKGLSPKTSIYTSEYLESIKFQIIYITCCCTKILFYNLIPHHGFKYGYTSLTPNNY